MNTAILKTGVYLCPKGENLWIMTKLNYYKRIKMIHFRKTVGKTLCGQRSLYKSESTCLAKEVTCSKCKNILLQNTMLMSEEELVWMNNSQKQRHEEEVASAKELRDINEKLRREIVRLRKKIDALASQEGVELLKRENKFLLSSLIEKEKKIKSLQDTIDRLSIRT